MSFEIDILQIDEKVKNKFRDEQSKCISYREKIEEIDLLLSKLEDPLDDFELSPHMVEKLEYTKEGIEEKIRIIEENTEFNFYLMESIELIDKYKEILSKPIVRSFMGKPKKKNKEKMVVVKSYLSVAERYINIHVSFPKKSTSVMTCPNCNSKEFDIVEESVFICQECSTEQIGIQKDSSYKDITRVNISSKYVYDRKVHFKDCINQYQGKQNSTIQQKVYDDLETEFRKHGLLSDGENKFENISKKQIEMFLKDLGYTKHYENVNLIHYVLTGIKPDDIGYLEDRLLEDFDLLIDLYDKQFKHTIQRKNFINTHYVLYQLLIKHRHPCNRTDFPPLKNIDIQNFHDDICQSLFKQLGWNFTPSF